MTIDTFEDYCCELKKIHSIVNEIAGAFGACDTNFDEPMSMLEETVCNELIDSLNLPELNGGPIDWHEIFFSWFYNFYLVDKKPEKYLIKIDKEEFIPKDPRSFYETFERISELWDNAKDIDVYNV